MMGKFKTRKVLASPRKDKKDKDRRSSSKPTFPTAELVRLLEHLQTSEETCKTEGVFRISGNSIEIKSLVKQLQKKRDTKFNEFTIHALTGALKLWFRNLPEPIMKSELYPAWMKAVDIPEKPAQLSAFKRLLQLLGPESRNILENLIKLLVKIELNRQTTLMNSKNLAIVFSPTLLRAPATVVDVVQLLGEQVKGSVVIESLITEFKFFFQSTASNYADAQNPPTLNRQVSIPEQEFFSCFAECSVSWTKSILQRQKARAEPEAQVPNNPTAANLVKLEANPISLSDPTSGQTKTTSLEASKRPGNVHRHTLGGSNNTVKPAQPKFSKSSKLPRMSANTNESAEENKDQKALAFVPAVPQLNLDTVPTLAPSNSNGGISRSPRASRALLASARSRSPRSLRASDGAEPFLLAPSSPRTLNALQGDTSPRSEQSDTSPRSDSSPRSQRSETSPRIELAPQAPPSPREVVSPRSGLVKPPQRPKKPDIHERRKQLRKKITAKQFAEGDLLLARSIAANLKLASNSSLEHLLSPQNSPQSSSTELPVNLAQVPTEPPVETSTSPQDPLPEEGVSETKLEEPIPTSSSDASEENPNGSTNTNTEANADGADTETETDAETDADASDSELSPDDPSLAQDLVLGILSGNVEDVVACVHLLDADQCTKLLQSVLGDNIAGQDLPGSGSRFDFDLDYDAEEQENSDPEDDEAWEFTIDEPELDPSLFSDTIAPLSQEEIQTKVELERQLSLERIL